MERGFFQPLPFVSHYTKASLSFVDAITAVVQCCQLKRGQQKASISICRKDSFKGNVASVSFIVSTCRATERGTGQGELPAAVHCTVTTVWGALQQPEAVMGLLERSYLAMFPPDLCCSSFAAAEGQQEGCARVLLLTR